MSQDSTFPIIPLDTYIRRAFKKFLENRSRLKNVKSAKGQVASDAVHKMCLFLNEFVRDISRSSIKIAQNANRKTILKDDIDVAVFTLYHPLIYRNFGPERLKYHETYLNYFNDHLKLEKTKSRYTMMEKYNLFVPPARIEKIMRLISTPQQFRIADDAVLLMTVLVDKILQLYLGNSVSKKCPKYREVLDPIANKKTIYFGTISWDDMLRVEELYLDTKISMCKYKKDI